MLQGESVVDIEGKPEVLNVSHYGRVYECGGKQYKNDENGMGNRLGFRRASLPLLSKLRFDYLCHIEGFMDYDDNARPTRIERLFCYPNKLVDTLLRDTTPRGRETALKGVKIVE